LKKKFIGSVQQQFIAKHGRSTNLIHGHASRPHLGGHTPEYISWSNMVQRCTNPNREEYRFYGGANPPVAVCERWMIFENFIADMGLRPEGTTLSRFGDAGNYEPSNCAWHTWVQQGAEKRKKTAMKVAA
jgi:hypothetical protein